jgi:hypothetical protein
LFGQDNAVSINDLFFGNVRKLEEEAWCCVSLAIRIPRPAGVNKVNLVRVSGSSLSILSKPPAEAILSTRQ